MVMATTKSISVNQGEYGDINAIEDVPMNCRGFGGQPTAPTKEEYSEESHLENSMNSALQQRPKFV